MLHYALRRPVPHPQREQQVCRPAFRLRQPRLFCDDPRKKYLIHIHSPFYRSCVHFLCCLLRRPGRLFPSLFCRSLPPYGAQLSLPPHQRADPYSDVSQSGVSLPLSGLTVLLAPWACVPASPFTPSRRRSSHIPVTLFPAAFVQVPGYAVFKVRLSGFFIASHL